VDAGGSYTQGAVEMETGIHFLSRRRDLIEQQKSTISCSV
jgi:hypothetical protein